MKTLTVTKGNLLRCRPIELFVTRDLTDKILQDDSYADLDN